MYHLQNDIYIELFAHCIHLMENEVNRDKQFMFQNFKDKLRSILNFSQRSQQDANEIINITIDRLLFYCTRKCITFQNPFTFSLFQKVQCPICKKFKVDEMNSINLSISLANYSPDGMFSLNEILNNHRIFMGEDWSCDCQYSYLNLLCFRFLLRRQHRFQSEIKLF